jgi:exopolysaccharide production protein ExoQ
MLQKAFDTLASLMAVLAFNAYLGLWKDGGAREEGLTNTIAYDGPLNSLPIIWGALALGAVIFVCLAARVFPRPNRWLTLLVGLAMASALWSEVPKSAIGGTLLLIAAYALISMHVRITPVDELIRKAIFAFLVIEVTSLIAVFLLPDYGVSIGIHDGEWQGVFTHKNQLGSFAVLAFCVSYGDWLAQRRWVSAVAALLAVVLVIGSQSTTALFIFVGLVTLLSACTSASVRRTVYKLRLPFVILPLAVGIFIVCASLFMDLGSTDEKFGTLSNRNLIWLYLFGKILISPWIGHGFEQLSVLNAANGSDFSSGVGFLVASAHNGFLEMLFALGAAGLIVTLITIISFAINLQQDALFPMMLGFLLLFLMENISESKLAGFNGDFIVFLYLIEANAKNVRLKKSLSENGCLTAREGR